MKELTKAEEQIMQILWEKGKGFVNDIIAEMPEPKPAYNTVSTITRILVKKEFVGFKAYGKSHEYFPLIEKDEYRRFFMNNFVGNYFNGSFQKMVSFFAKENDMNLSQVDALLNEVKGDLEKKEGNE